MFRPTLTAAAALTLAAPALAQDSGQEAEEPATPPPSQAELNKESDSYRAEEPGFGQESGDESDEAGDDGMAIEMPDIELGDLGLDESDDSDESGSGADDEDGEDAPER